MATAEIEIEGTCAPGFEPVREAFARNFAERGEGGAAVAAQLGERALVDLWGGFADAARTRRWRRDTLVQVYSASKPLAAACLLVLADRGAVDLDAPVAAYWPEFAAAGKAAVPVRWLLDHRAGMIGLRRPQPTATLYDWDRVVTLLAAEAPWWEPGTRIGEQALFFGHLVGEVVRRVDGRSLGRFFADEVARPLGLDAHIGLGEAERARTAELCGLTAELRRRKLGEPGSFAHRALANPPGLLDPEVVNGAAWRAAEVPAVNGHATARALARFHALLAAGGALGGTRLLSPAMVGHMTSVQSRGVDAFIGEEATWGLGVAIWDGDFGMGGIGGSVGVGSRASGLGFGYVTATMADHDRADAVEEALAAALAAAGPPGTW